MNRPLAALLLPAFVLAGCSSWNMPSWNMPSLPSLPAMPSLSSMVETPKWAAIKPYTLDIQQGVVIDEDMIARLKPGMSRTQVGYVLGSPLLADPFHANRWDYVFYTRKKNKMSQVHNLSVYFKADKMDRFESDYPFPVKSVEPPKTAKAAEAQPAGPAEPPPDVLPQATRPVTTGGH